MFVKKIMFLVLFVLLGVMSTKVNAMQSGDEEIIKLAEQGDVDAQYNLGLCYANGQGVDQSYKEAVKWFGLAANQGDVYAQYVLGLCYVNGRGVDQDYKEAVRWFRLSSEHGNADAQYNLGLCYVNGRGVVQDYKESVRWFRLSVEQDNVDAQYVLGLCYANGWGVDQDYKEAVRWFRLSSEHGNADAQYNLGLCYTNGWGVDQDYNEAVKWYKLAAEQDNSDAQYGLGECYANGRGVAQSYEEAARWFRLSAEQGNVDAQYKLGMYYANGLGVEQNYKEAIRWFRLSAEQGNADAQYILGECYANGLGVDQSYGEAVKWYKLSAEQGNVTAQLILVWYYNQGQGVKQSYEDAVKWLRLAAEQDNSDAQYGLGECYANGRGVAQSYEEAARWFRLSAEQGNVDAQYKLGMYYANGLGVEQNYEEAVRWFRLSAEQGNAEAQYSLGECYVNGRGVAQSYEEAVRWFRLSAEQGNAEAQYSLGECYVNGRGVAQSYEEAIKWYRLAANQGNAEAQHVLEVLIDLAEAAKWFHLNRLETAKDKDSMQVLVDSTKRICNLFSELEKIETREQGLEFVIIYFSEHFGRIRKFLEENGIADYKDEALIRDKIDSKAIDVSVLNKLLTEAYDALECAKFVLTHADSDTNSEALDRVLRFISEKDFCITLSRSDIILTDAFLASYVISPWRTIKVPDDEMQDVGILANIFGAGFSRDLVHCNADTVGENIYDYIFGDKGRMFKNRFLYLCVNDEGRARSLLAREMHWLRCMKEKYDTGGFTEDKKKNYEKCINLVETQFLSVTGACSNELADVMIMWAADIDACEDAMGIGARICDQKVFDERFTTAYRQYLYERVLSNDYVLSIRKESDLVKRLSSALCSGCGPEFRNFYRFLVARLLNVIPMLGNTFIADREITGQDMVALVSEAVDLNDMCKVAQDMYQGLADEKDAQAEESRDLSSETEEEPIKEKLAIDIESSYKVSFKEFCTVVDKTCAGDFEKRLRDFLSCEFDDMDESTRQAIKDMESWISGERAFTIGELVNMTLNIDLTYSHTENIPELTRFGSVIGGRGEKSAEYYAKVLYPIHLLKAGFIKMS